MQKSITVTLQHRMEVGESFHICQPKCSWKLSRRQTVPTEANKMCVSTGLSISKREQAILNDILSHVDTRKTVQNCMYVFNRTFQRCQRSKCLKQCFLERCVGVYF